MTRHPVAAGPVPGAFSPRRTWRPARRLQGASGSPRDDRGDAPGALPAAWRAVLVALTLLAPAATVASAEPLEEAPSAPGTEWLRVDSDHFTLFGNRPRAALVEAGVALERLRGFLAALAPGTELDAARPTRIYLFGDAASFAPFRLPDDSGIDAGYFLPGERAGYAAFAIGKPTTQVVRQYVQELLHRHLPGLPAWLHHGLVEYYSTFQAETGEVRLGLPPPGYLFWLRNKGNGPFSGADLLSAEAPTLGESIHRDHVQTRETFRARSWALVHHLMSQQREGRQRIGAYLRRLRAGEDPVAAFAATFDIDPAGLDELLAEYVRRETLTFLRITTAGDEEPATRVSPMSEAEIAYRLGDLALQLGAGHRAVAEEHLARAAELDPEHALAWAGLGRLAERAGDDGTALARFERAASLAPDDPAVLLAYGNARLRALGGRRADDEAAERALAEASEALRRAAELDPESGEAWAALGQARLLAADPDPDAVSALERAVDLLPPGRTDVLYNLLLARARTGDLAGVEAAEAELREAGSDDALLHRAREMRLQVAVGLAHRLATSDRLDDAVALLAMARRATTDPALAERAEALLARVAPAAAHNRFADGYSEAVDLYRAGDLAAAAAKVEEMLGEARPGRQVEVLAELRELIAAQGSP